MRYSPLIYYRGQVETFSDIIACVIVHLFDKSRREESINLLFCTRFTERVTKYKDQPMGVPTIFDYGAKTNRRLSRRS